MIELKGKYNQDCKIFLDDIEQGAIDLIQNILNHEVSKGVQVRIMPDTHIGKGIVIGFTMPMTEMINPNYIGVDIGCSVTSYQLNRRFHPSELSQADKVIRRTIPMGHQIHKGKNFDYAWVDEYLNEVTTHVNSLIIEWNKRTLEHRTSISIDKRYITNLCKKIGIEERVFYNSIGTLGGGNHFIEVGQSQGDGSHYLTIHSGSRNFGLKVCNYHTQKMTPSKKSSQEQLLEGEDMFNYLVDMVIAQTYAEFNHKVMADSIFKELKDTEPVDKTYSMHNFIDPRDWIIRKGAIRSYEGERMIIPFNMRDGLLICEGKSNADWNYSAPHGAGRVLGRNQAFRSLSMNHFIQEMKGVYSTSIHKKTLDEAPMAYKDKNFIINAIADTAVIIDFIKPILNIKSL